MYQALKDKDFYAERFRRVPKFAKGSPRSPNGFNSSIAFVPEVACASRLEAKVFNRFAVPTR